MSNNLQPARNRSNRLLVFVSALASIVLISAVVLIALLNGPWHGVYGPGLVDKWSDNMVPAPKNLQDILERSDLVALGSIKSVKRSFRFDGYDSKGLPIVTEASLRETDFQLPSLPPLGAKYIAPKGQPVSGLPVTDYEVVLDDVYYANSVVKQNTAITVRLFGFYSESAGYAEYAKTVRLLMAKPGDQNLFSLTRLPDGAYGLISGDYGQLVISGETIRVASVENSELTLEGVSSKTSEFLPALRTAATKKPIVQSANR